MTTASEIPINPGPSVRRPRQFTLEELFTRVLHVRYCLLSDPATLPHNPPEETGKIVILTDSLLALRSLWELTRIGPGRYDAMWHAQLSTGKLLPVTIYEKGRNVFPEQFESALLLRTILHSDCVKVPSSQDAPYLLLYQMVIQQGQFADDPRVRQILLDHIFGYVGSAMRSRYPDLEFHSKRNLAPKR